MLSPTKKSEGKNGLAFEVILDTAKSTTPAKLPAKLTPHNTPNRILTNDDIKNKLAKAEERRLVRIFLFFFLFNDYYDFFNFLLFIFIYVLET